jgi:hypothetical protein
MGTTYVGQGHNDQSGVSVIGEYLATRGEDLWYPLSATSSGIDGVI